MLIAKPIYTIIKNNKKNLRMGKIEPIHKSIQLLRVDINYWRDTHTSFGSFYMLTVVYKWQLDS